MKKILKIFGILVLFVVLVVVGFLTFIHFRGVPSYEVEKVTFEVHSTPESVARGKKLASMLCANCHMDNEAGKLIGKRMNDAPPEFGAIYSANITQDSLYGIGNYTDGELAYLLRTGIKKNGQYSPPWMAKLPHMSNEDINAIISFLRSDEPMVQASAVVDKPCEPSFLTKFLCFVAFKPLPYPTEVIAQPDTTNPVEWGKYLAFNLDCFTCHSSDFKTLNIMEPEKSGGFFAGGNKPLNMEGEVVLTPNLTPDMETGIGSWSEEKFVKAVKYGLVEGRDALQYPMMPYINLADAEAKAIYAYLRTVPAVKNKVK